MSFAEDSKGNIWIGTFFSGLHSYNTYSNKVTHYNNSEFVKHNINTSNIRKVLVDNKDNVWIGTRSGLYRINKRENENFNILEIKDRKPTIASEKEIKNNNRARSAKLRCATKVQDHSFEFKRSHLNLEKYFQLEEVMHA